MNAQGSILGEAAFTAWGSALFSTLPNTPFKWEGRVGEYEDSETGLVLCGARYYSPLIGLFITRDPIGFKGGVNVYSYCAGNPAMLTDPQGRAVQIGVSQGVQGLLDGVYGEDGITEFIQFFPIDAGCQSTTGLGSGWGQFQLAGFTYSGYYGAPATDGTSCDVSGGFVGDDTGGSGAVSPDGVSISAGGKTWVGEGVGGYVCGRVTRTWTLSGFFAPGGPLWNLFHNFVDPGEWYGFVVGPMPQPNSIDDGWAAEP